MNHTPYLTYHHSYLTQMLLNTVHTLLTTAHTLLTTPHTLLDSGHIFSRYLILLKNCPKFLSYFTYHDSYLTDLNSYLFEPFPEIFIFSWTPPWNIHILLNTTTHTLLIILNSYFIGPSRQFLIRVLSFLQNSSSMSQKSVGLNFEQKFCRSSPLFFWCHAWWRLLSKSTVLIPMDLNNNFSYTMIHIRWCKKSRCAFP